MLKRVSCLFLVMLQFYVSSLNTCIPTSDKLVDNLVGPDNDSGNSFKTA